MHKAAGVRCQDSFQMNSLIHNRVGVQNRELGNTPQILFSARKSVAMHPESVAMLRKSVAKHRNSVAKHRNSFAKHRKSFAKHRKSFAKHPESFAKHRKSFAKHPESVAKARKSNVSTNWSVRSTLFFKMDVLAMMAKILMMVLLAYTINI